MNGFAFWPQEAFLSLAYSMCGGNDLLAIGRSRRCQSPPLKSLQATPNTSGSTER
ncbi:hypothetical protein ACLM45_12815 [Synechococcus sp. A10-1-5-9]|uniref:hypothetical protein n=1 Tax=Synechococcus sp. A10-1-5-9 TaxID=3392295 RepID=UPI0039EB3601